MPVKGDGGAPLVEGAREVTRTEEGVDLRRFTFDGGADRRVVENCHALLCFQPLQLMFESLRLQDTFRYPGFEELLAERVGQVPVKAAAETLHTRKSYAIDDYTGAIEEIDVGLPDQVRQLGRVAALVVMVPQRGEDGDGAHAQNLEEHLHLLEAPKIGEISPDSEDIGVTCG